MDIIKLVKYGMYGNDKQLNMNIKDKDNEYLKLSLRILWMSSCRLLIINKDNLNWC